MLLKSSSSEEKRRTAAYTLYLTNIHNTLILVLIYNSIGTALLLIKPCYWNSVEALVCHETRSAADHVNSKYRIHYTAIFSNLAAYFACN